MVNYPLSAGEFQAIRWAERIVPTLAAVIILLLGATSIASAAG
jgi:hypothetical protein